MIFRVHVEDANRRPSGGRLADNIDAAPLKVIVPPLVSRMKQLGDPTSMGIDPREVWALVKIAVNASQSQVVEIVAPAMNPWDDVLDVKCGKWRIFLSVGNTRTDFRHVPAPDLGAPDSSSTVWSQPFGALAAEGRRRICSHARNLRTRPVPPP